MEFYEKWVMMSYLYGAINLIHSFGGEKPILVGFINANMARDIDSRKHTLGYLVKLICRGSYSVTIKVTKVYCTSYHIGKV